MRHDASEGVEVYRTNQSKLGVPTAIRFVRSPPTETPPGQPAPCPTMQNAQPMAWHSKPFPLDFRGLGSEVFGVSSVTSAASAMGRARGG